MEQLRKILHEDATERGYDANRWTSPDVSDMIAKIFNVILKPRAVRYVLKKLRLSYQKPDVKDIRQSQEELDQWIKSDWPRLKKVKKQGLPIVFLDESGYSLRAFPGKTWSPIGQPPVLREFYCRDNQSGIGFLSVSPKTNRLSFHLSMVSGAINTEDMIVFLTQLHHYYGKRAMVIMDRLAAHRTAAEWFVQFHPKWFCIEYLPAYCPELNPVEYSWHWMKNVKLANVAASNTRELRQNVLNAAECLNSNKPLLRSFLKQSNLRL